MACVAAAQQDKCASWSYTATVGGMEVVTNAGGCGNAEFCATTKTGAELAGTITDFKCGTCDGDKCNTEATATADAPAGGNDEPAGGNDEPAGGNDEPAGGDAATGKKFYLEDTVAKTCYTITAQNDCTVAKLANAETAFSVFKVGDCPAAYTTECSMTTKDASGDENKIPSDAKKEDSDKVGCGTLRTGMMTKDCAACTAQGDNLDEGEQIVSGPTCSSGSALAFGLAALVASLFF